MKSNKTAQFNRSVRANGSDDGKRWDEVVEPTLVEVPIETEKQRNDRILDELRKKIGGMPSTPSAPRAPKTPVLH